MPIELGHMRALADDDLRRPGFQAFFRHRNENLRLGAIADAETVVVLRPGEVDEIRLEEYGLTFVNDTLHAPIALSASRVIATRLSPRIAATSDFRFEDGTNGDA